MFSGIIETVGTVKAIDKSGSNITYTIESTISHELKVDQSVAHNGVCLTVESVANDQYTVTAVEETLEKTNMNSLAVGTKINLERSVRLGDRMDGHIVQGHVDTVGSCIDIKDVDGSWQFHFKFPSNYAGLLVPKGSITVNGVSLTVNNPTADSFWIAIIPYTFAHTTFGDMRVGDSINLEFDIIGKYALRQSEFAIQ